MLASAAGAVAVLTALCGPMRPASTAAEWTGSQAAQSQVTAIDIPEPITSQTPGCTTSSVLGANPTVTIYWRIPAGADGYTKDNAEYGQIVNQGLLEPILSDLLGSVNTTGTSSAYVTVINGGLLSGLLGATKTFGIRLIGPGGWTSDWLVATASLGLLGANPKCTISTSPR